MKIYTVYLKEGSDPLEDAEYLSEGFSWKAFIFSFFWLIYHKLWVQGAAIFILFIVIGELAGAGAISEGADVILRIGVCAYIGFAGKDYLRKRLESEGYDFVDVVLAKSIDEAEYKFIDSLIKKHQTLEK